MKKIIALLLTLASLASLQTVRAASLYPVVVNGRWGYVDKTGKFVINPQFDDAESFADGLARVKVGGKTGYVDLGGKYVWNPSK